MRIPRICFALAAAVLVAGLLPTTALAQGEAKPSLLVLYLDSDGASDKQKEDVLAATKKVVAKYGKYKLLDTPKLDLLDEMVNFECIEMDADCMSAIGKAEHLTDDDLTKIEKRFNEYGMSMDDFDIGS